MSQYHYTDSNGQPAGPVPFEQLHALKSQGVINENTWVIKVGDSEWVAYSTLAQTLNRPPPGPPPIPTKGISQPTVQPATIKTPLSPAKKGCLGCLGLFVLLVIIGSLASEKSQEGKSVSKKDSPEKKAALAKSLEGYYKGQYRNGMWDMVYTEVWFMDCGKQVVIVRTCPSVERERLATSMTDIAEAAGYYTFATLNGNFTKKTVRNLGLNKDTKYDKPIYSLKYNDITEVLNKYELATSPQPPELDAQ